MSENQRQEPVDVTAQHRELFNKEMTDARRRSQRYGLPFFVFRGKIYYADGRPSETVTEPVQMLWDALA